MALAGQHRPQVVVRLGCLRCEGHGVAKQPHRLIELAGRRGGTIKVVDRGREVTVETGRRRELVDLVRTALERSAPARG
jgi:hypothetical protein